jgi:hypothetical protein
MPSNYEIGTGLSEQEFKVASFWVKNRLLLRQIGYGSLIGVSVLLWGFVLWSLLDAFAISWPREERIGRVITSNQLTIESLRAVAPDPIQSSEVSVFTATEGRRDMLVEITNPNDMWAARFTYRFNLGGELTPERTGYVLPNSQRYLTEHGFVPTNAAQTARLAIENIEWLRVTPAQVGDSYENYAARRLDFAFDEITYESGVELGESEIGQTRFIMNNHSPYGYWGVDLTVILYRADRPVGVTTITEREILPGESRNISISWPDNITGVSRTEIRASVDILDPDSFLPTERF